LNAVNTSSRRELEILNSIAEGCSVSQRALAARLGIALGLANLYIKRLARKGYIKVTTIPPNRIKYLVTPRGVAQKTRLTYEYMRYSLALYRDARRTLRESLSQVAQNGAKRLALYGTGEAAELAYLTLKELGLEPVVVLDRMPGGRFLGQPVQGVADLSPGDYDYVVVATLDATEPILAELRARGIAPAKLVPLRRGPW
jgi:DNA-binding MarR family transcriptional regulator